MSLKEHLDARCICLDLQGTDKQSIIEEMVDLLVAAGKVSDRRAALQAILDREAKMSTGMQNGVAIPHGKTPSVSTLHTAVAVRQTPIDFDALDGEPCNLFIMTLSPIDNTGPHIQFLSEISRVLADAGNRRRLAAASTPDEAIAVLCG